MSAAPVTTHAAAEGTSAVSPADDHQAWNAAEAAYWLSRGHAKGAFHLRMNAALAAMKATPLAQPDNWPLIASLPQVAPLVREEQAANAAEKVAARALLATDTPDWRAWVVKYGLAREHADDLLDPRCKTAWKEVRKRGDRGFPGTVYGFEAEHIALLAYAGLADAAQVARIPTLLARAAKAAGIVIRDDVNADLEAFGFARLCADAHRLLMAKPTAPALAREPIARERTAWEEALAAVDHWWSVADQESAAYHAAFLAVGAEIPEGLYEENRFGRHLRWRSLEVFDRCASELMPSVRSDLRAKLEAWLPRYAELRELHQLDEHEREDDPTFDARHAAQDALFAMPPPSNPALIQKIALASKEIDDEKNGFADPAYLSQQLHSYLPERILAQVYLDLHGLIGVPAPVGAEFNPRVWIKAYEAVGGGVQEKADRGGLLLGRAFECPDPVACRSLEDELYATPWKARAVRLEIMEDGYKTRADATTNRGRFSWVQFTDDDFKTLTPRIHFAMEGDVVDEDVIAPETPAQRADKIRHLQAAMDADPALAERVKARLASHQVGA